MEGRDEKLSLRKTIKMPFFQKFKNTLLAGISRTTDSLDDKASFTIAARYPDVEELVEVLGMIMKRVEHESCHGSACSSADVKTGIDNKNLGDVLGVKHDHLNELSDIVCSNSETSVLHDSKWSPGLITLGLLFKLQNINEHTRELGWYNDRHVFLKNEDEQAKMMHVFGLYWHIMVKIGESIRSYDLEKIGTSDRPSNQIRLRTHVKNALEFAGLRTREEVLLAHISDQNQEEEGHCPDFALIIIHEHRQILLNICGNRLVNIPRIADVFADLMADSAPFLKGRAHKEMVDGCVSVFDQVRDSLYSAIAKHPDYGLLISGYSHGAGIAPLLAMQLLSMQEDASSGFSKAVTIRSICYGAPPVYFVDKEDQTCLLKVPNIFLVYNNHDGLASTSIETFTKIFEAVKAIEDLNLGRTEMIKMLMKPILVELPGINLDEDNGEDSSGEETVVDASKLSSSWARVQEAVESVEAEDKSGKTHYRHTAGHLYMLNRKVDCLLIRKFEDTKPMADRMRLKAGMFNQHMPWSYSALFDGYGFSNLKVPMEDFEEVLTLEE